MWKMPLPRSRPPLPVVAQPGAAFEFPYSSDCPGAEPASPEGEEERQPLCVEKILAYAMLWQQTP